MIEYAEGIDNTSGTNLSIKSITKTNNDDDNNNIIIIIIIIMDLKLMHHEREIFFY